MKSKKTVLSNNFIYRWSRKYSWWLIVGLLVTAISLIITALILVVIGKPEYKETLIKVAKIFGAGGTVLGSLKAFWKNIKNRFALIRLQQTSGHIVVCGLSDIGLLLVNTFVSQGNKVVVIEAKKDHPDISSCHERGVLVISGDASDGVLMDELNTARAKYLFAVTGSDVENIEIAHQGQLLAIETANNDSMVKLRCYAHLAGAELCSIFASHVLFSKAYDEFDASLFNLYETAARVVLEKYSPDCFARQLKINGPELSVMVIGFEEMGENIVNQLLRIGHYADWESLNLTVIDRKMTERGEKFLALHGDARNGHISVVPEVALDFVARDPECLRVSDFSGNSHLSVIYMTLNDDAVGVALAWRIRQMLASDEIPIIVCMRSALSGLMADNAMAGTAGRNIYGFNILENGCGYQALMEEVTDQLARAIHQCYVDSQKGLGNDTEPAWEALSEAMKNSNRWAADHLSVKLRALGLDGQEPTAVSEALREPSLLETLAEMEHRRWVAANIMAGWRYAPGVKDRQRKTHPLLATAYRDLPEDEKQKDREMILTIPDLLASSGWRKQTVYIAGL